MTQIQGNANQPANGPVYPLAPLPASVLEGVRRRRIAALGLDLIFVGTLSVGVWAVITTLSLGLLWFVLPSLFAFFAFFYNGITVSGWRMATPGMKAMDLEMRTVAGERVSFLHAAVHAVLFYLCWGFPILFLFSLLSSDKRCLHDVLAGVIVLRRA